MATILIVDDDVHVTQLMKAHFSERGHQVTVAHRGEEGILLAAALLPDLIFLDVILPDVTGFQMCSRLRKIPAMQNTPILMITGVARFPNQKTYAMERGANEYILKPFDILHVGEMVDHYIASKPHSPAPLHKTTMPHPSEKSTTPDLGGLSHFLRKAIEKSKLNR